MIESPFHDVRRENSSSYLISIAPNLQIFIKNFSNISKVFDED